jgi:hypothetical protein
MYGQQAGQQNTVAAAQNALNAFNAQNTQQANLANQQTQQQANSYNTQNAQNVSNQNVTGKNQAQYQNQVEAPQQAFGMGLQKAQGAAGVNEAQAKQYTQQGQQGAGLLGGLLGAGATAAGAYFGGPIGKAAASNAVNMSAPQQGSAPESGIPGMAMGGEVDTRPKVPAVNFLRGGPVPGQAMMPGNNIQNDTVPARLSPGEFVVPREAMANPNVRHFLEQNVPTPNAPIHHSDLASMMKALTMLRQGA